MFTITKTQTRPSASVAFWTNQGVPAETFEYISNTHQHNILDSQTAISEDGLTLTKITTWSSKEAYDNFLADEVLSTMFDNCHTYMNDNGITYTTGNE